MSAKPVQTLESILNSMGIRFDEEAGALFSDSVLGVMNQIRAVPGTVKRKHLETCREMFKGGCGGWLEALVELVNGYAEKLVHVVVSCPISATDDPAKWITVQLKLLLTKHLRQELSLEILSQQAIQRNLSRTGPFTSFSGFTYKIACEISRLQGATSDASLNSKPHHPDANSRVGSWFRWVAENGPDFDRSESGFHEPWMAPAFVSDAGLKERMSSLPPDRLTAAQTEHAIRKVETCFAGRFDYVLRQIEHKARITLGTNGAVPIAQSLPEVHGKIATLPVKATNLIQWNGTDRSLTDKILKQYADGQIVAASQTEALRKESERYVRKNGTRFNPKSMWQSIKNRQADGK